GGRIEEVAARMGNALQAVTGKDHPEIAYIIEEIKKAGALSAIMTGSGPTVFGLFSEEAACRKAARKIAGAQPHWFVRPTRFYPS
ncbi:MAG: 4-(cytidine 5'-diphospho)-2-C-methyl-D-erythritol kinase, partial [Lachnospiraceae bacterium]|nr:4-(cytidine 5'-diphospho)-2-C-methyl-D-erythritol kinase [Lachnospiraceae bacterium]